MEEIVLDALERAVECLREVLLVCGEVEVEVVLSEGETDGLDGGVEGVVRFVFHRETLTHGHIHAGQVQGTIVGCLAHVAVSENVCTIKSRKVDIDSEVGYELYLAEVCLEVLYGFHQHNTRLSCLGIVAPLGNVEICNTQVEVYRFVPRCLWIWPRCLQLIEEEG